MSKAGFFVKTKQTSRFCFYTLRNFDGETKTMDDGMTRLEDECRQVPETTCYQDMFIVRFTDFIWNTALYLPNAFMTQQQLMLASSKIKFSVQKCDKTISENDFFNFFFKIGKDMSIFFR